MGFSTDLLQQPCPPDMVCCICYDLLDPNDSLVTPCAHVYCTSCILQAAESFHQCPFDRQQLHTDDLRPFRDASPLGFRMLADLRVSCADCHWTGRLGALQCHQVVCGQTQQTKIIFKNVNVYRCPFCASDQTKESVNLHIMECAFVDQEQVSIDNLGRLVEVLARCEKLSNENAEQLFRLIETVWKDSEGFRQRLRNMEDWGEEDEDDIDGLVSMITTASTRKDLFDTQQIHNWCIEALLLVLQHYFDEDDD